jgi:hypothetical protein
MDFIGPRQSGCASSFTHPDSSVGYCLLQNSLFEYTVSPGLAHARSIGVMGSAVADEGSGGVATAHIECDCGGGGVPDGRGRGGSARHRWAMVGNVEVNN